MPSFRGSASTVVGEGTWYRISIRCHETRSRYSMVNVRKEQWEILAAAFAYMMEGSLNAVKQTAFN